MLAASFMLLGEFADLLRQGQIWCYKSHAHRVLGEVEQAAGVGNEARPHQLADEDRQVGRDCCHPALQVVVQLPPVLCQCYDLQDTAYVSILHCTMAGMVTSETYETMRDVQEMAGTLICAAQGGGCSSIQPVQFVRTT